MLDARPADQDERTTKKRPKKASRRLDSNQIIEEEAKASANSSQMSAESFVKQNDN